MNILKIWVTVELFWCENSDDVRMYVYFNHLICCGGSKEMGTLKEAIINILYLHAIYFQSLSLVYLWELDSFCSYLI